MRSNAESRLAAGVRTTTRLSTLSLISLLPSILSLTSVAQGADLAATFSTIKPSIAIIGTDDGVGTGFCVASTGSFSYYLTNAHVVGSATSVTVYRHDPTEQILKGTVMATGGAELDPDLAVVRVPAGNIPPLRLRLSSLNEGSPVATAGYPSAQYRLAAFSGELVPAVHIGSISAIVNRGRVIEYDAQTLPGNSGGPLLDPTSGDVLGVVEAKIKQSSDANIAIGIGEVVAPFLKQNEIAFTAAPESSEAASPASTDVAASSDAGPIRTLPGAGTVAIVYDTSLARGEATAPALAASAADFADKFRQQFSVRTVVLDQHTTSAAELAEIAKSNNAIIAVPFGASFQTTHSYANAFGSDLNMTLRLNIGLVDPYGFVWFGATASKDVYSHKDAYSAIKSSFDDLSDRDIESVVALLQGSSLNANSATINLFRYGLAMADGEKRMFLGLKPELGGARVVSVPPFSVAVEAGIQLGDLVTSINGTSVVGKSLEEVITLEKTATESGAVDLVVVGGDGKEQRIKFQPQDLRWYVEHRASVRS